VQVSVVVSFPCHGVGLVPLRARFLAGNISLIKKNCILISAACKQFTPVLEEMYRTLKAQKHIEDFEVVLCSGDVMTVTHKNYASKMPWWCLPFQSPSFQRLSLIYKVMGFPSLVVIDSDGTLLKHDAVNQVVTDSRGLCFPWRPPSLQDVLPEQYLRPDHTYAPTSLLDDKYILFFAAGSWSPPCHDLLHRVSHVYHRLRAHRDDVEVSTLSL
jgi:thiol-disulfide isomerase/thioredoxin